MKDPKKNINQNRRSFLQGVGVTTILGASLGYNISKEGLNEEDFEKAYKFLSGSEHMFPITLLDKKYDRSEFIQILTPLLQDNFHNSPPKGRPSEDTCFLSCSF